MIKLLTKVFLILFIFDAVALNLGVGYLVYLKFADPGELKKDSNSIPELVSKTSVSEDSCGEACRKYIDLKLSQALSTDQKVTEPTVTPATSQAKSKITRVNYVPVPGSGSTLKTSWTDIGGTDFYFDKGEFPGFQEATFEANMRLFNGNGEGFIRLFDVTHSVGVVGSELKTSSQSSVLLISGRLQFYSGRNLYRVQARSLTADTTIFDSGRIKVISQE